MRAVVIEGPGGPEVLKLVTVEDPVPGPGQVRVRVRAAGLNRADLLQRMGHYPAPSGTRQDIPGLEFAGEVERRGPGAEQFESGQRVFGIAAGEAQAERVVVHERLLVATPEGLDDVSAAAVPEAFITAHDALVTQAGIKPGERLLVHAVGSGVGTAAVQLAHAMGCTVVGTSRTAGKLEQARALGMDVGIHVQEAKFAGAVNEATRKRGVQVIADLVGGDYFAENLACLAPQGRMVVIGLLGGASAPIDLAALLTRRLHVWGTSLRARPLEQKIAAVQDFAEQVVPLLARGLLKPVIDRVYPVQAIQAAHHQMASNETFGKIVLTF